jgi:hypothetical protein
VFDFSKIKSHGANNDSSLFQKQYTELQKAAILGALLWAILKAKSVCNIHRSDHPM